MIIIINVKSIGYASDIAKKKQLKDDKNKTIMVNIIDFPFKVEWKNH